ncbi:MAG TPA: ABC transporter permease [Acidimicrobiales bacterium]|nr:ABC transporter permease [Acidimicrobiales bacterium]
MQLAGVAGRVRAHSLGGPAARAVLAAFGLFVFVQALFGRLPLLGIGRADSPVPPGIFARGIVIGSLYALVAIGIILVYRANRIINFAAAGLGSVPAVFTLVLMSRKGLPYAIAIPLALIGGAALGALVEVVFIRRFTRAPRLIVTVATLGVAQILAFIEFFIPVWLTGTAIPPSDFPTPFQNISFQIGIVRFTGDAVVTVVVVLGIVVALSAFFRFTDIGIAVRASAENRDRAALLGIPVRRVATIVWMLAGLLSAVGIFLRAPLVGLPLGGLIGPAILLFGLAAAVIARMESLGTAFVAGCALGVIDQSAVFSTRRPSAAYGVMLIVILGALLVQQKAIARAFDTGVSSFRAVRELRPIPPELRGLTEIRVARAVATALIVIVALAAPFMFGDARAGLAGLVAIYAMVGVSLVVLTGWTGQISLGQFALAGIGAAVTGLLVTSFQVDFFITVAVSGLVGAAIAVLVGIPALRIQGLLLAVTTLAFAFTVQNIVLNRDYASWLLPSSTEFVGRPDLYGVIDVSSDRAFYYVTLVFLVLSLWLARGLRNNRSGRILIGVRENSRVMQAFGVSPTRTRITAFAASGFIAAVAGSLLAFHQGSVDSGTFTPTASITVFVMTVIGGVNSLGGAVIGAIYVLGIPELPVLNDIDLIEVLSTGVGLLFLLLFLPGGLIEGVYRVRDLLLRRVAERHGIDVPSLVADRRTDSATPEATPIEVTDAHVPTDAELDAVEALLSDEIECPTCGERVSVAEAVHHEHLRPRTRRTAVAPGKRS